MKYGDPVKPISQNLDSGLLVRVLKMENVDDVTNTLQPYGLSPMSGRPLVGKNVGTIMGFEGGSGISVTNATEKYGKKGTLLRRSLRIDKCPWPNGQTNLRLRITVSYGHTIGLHGFSAPNKVYIRKWYRNTLFDETFSSDIAPSDDFLESNGFSPGSASVSIHLQAQGVGPGHPLVQDDENGLSETFVTCTMDNPVFSEGVTYIAMPPPYIRTGFLPCPQWVKHRMNFGDGFVGVLYAGGAFGLVMGVVVGVEAIGWDTGFHDLEGWHADTTLDPYAIPKPNSYEYPNYPISDPFNPTGEGVG